MIHGRLRRCIAGAGYGEAYSNGQVSDWIRVWGGDTYYLSGQLASPILGPDPKTGKLDFMGMQSEYVKYFGTKDQPNKPARSAFQVAALAAPWASLEIEVTAIKSK